VRQRILLGYVVAGLLLVSCGSDDDGVIEAGQGTTSTSAPATSTPSDSTTTIPEEPVSGDISLTVQVTADNQQLREGTLTCGDDGAARGGGFLADQAAADAACELLTGNEAAVYRLVQGQAPNMLCTQIYGGPEVAKVTGTIDGQRVAATIKRNDGCGIADWTMLVALLGSPNA
jgi:hypothetical protein